jgi:type II secretory pathway component HofQ
MAAAIPEETPEAETEGDRNDSCFKLLSGKRDSLSMDFQNANIKNLFRIIAEVSEFSLVLSPDVRGVISIRLVDFVS